MKYFLVAVIISLFYSKVLCMAVQPLDSYTVFTNTIKEGDCELKKGNILFFNNLVQADAIPGEIVGRKLSLNGNSENCKNIQCIIAVYNNTYTGGEPHPNPTTQRVGISDGGVGFDHVTFLMQSDPGYPLQYQFTISCLPIDDKIPTPKPEDLQQTVNN